MALIFALLGFGVAHAGPDETLDAFDRLEEILQLRVDDGQISKDELLPALLVEATPRYEASAGGFTGRSLELLTQVFGNQGLRMCEACMAPRTVVENGDLVMQAGPIGLDEVVRLDDRHRGEAQPARSAIWITEHPRGVSIRIVDLATGRVVFADNVDPTREEYRRTKRAFARSAEFERRARGASLTQFFFDAGLYPNQHISLDWTDQWGKTNRNLSGFTISAFDPVGGVGASHYRVTRLANVMVGGKVIVSVPTALGRLFNQDLDLEDPPLTLVGAVRVPFGRSNYGILATASTNGNFTLGISLMNISFLPVIP